MIIDCQFIIHTYESTINYNKGNGVIPFSATPRVTLVVTHYAKPEGVNNRFILGFQGQGVSM